MAKGNAAGAAIFWTRQKEEGKGQNHIAARKQVLTKGTINSSSMLDESSKENLWQEVLKEILSVDQGNAGGAINSPNSSQTYEME